MNVLRDGGSYSYNTDREAMQYFSGTTSHNTVQFDDRDQMPRLGPFLFGAWPDRSELTYQGDLPSVCAAYRDYAGAMHRRMVELTENTCVVRDEIADFRTKAVLRWRLAPANWAPRWHDGRIVPRQPFRHVGDCSIEHDDCRRLGVAPLRIAHANPGSRKWFLIVRPT